MADNPYTQSMLNPNVARNGMFDMRMMASANRMEQPFERGMGYRRSGLADRMMGGGSMPGDAPDYSQFTFDPMARQAATQALSHYGLSPLEASQVKPNVLLPNSGFFGAHPRMSAALEGGIFGGLAAHGGNTPGESMQGALEGMVGGQQIRRNLYDRQFARPFESAGMLEHLEDAQQKRDLQSADIEHLRAMNEHMANGDWDRAERTAENNRHNEALENMKNTQLGLQNDQLRAKAPVNLGGGLWGYYNPGGTGPNQKGEWSVQENPEAKLGRAANANAGKGPWYTYKGTDGKTRFGRAQEGGQVPENANAANSSPALGKQTPADVKRQAYMSKTRKPSELIGMGYGGDMTDGKAKEKFLGNFYDTQIAPNLANQTPPEGAAPHFITNPDGSHTEQ